MVKNLATKAGDIRDMDSIPESARSPGEGNGNPLQCSCLENPMDGGAWWATVHGVAKSYTRGLPVHHQLPEFTQTFVHHISDAIQPSHPLSSPSPPAFNLSQHQGFFQMSQFFASGGQSIGASASKLVLPMNTQD